MTIDEVYEFRKKIGCIGDVHTFIKPEDESKCDANTGRRDTCFSLTDEQVRKYVAKYGCICHNVKGPVCPHCICYGNDCEGTV